ncbi:MAG TPA: glycoside hydrolase family 43 protein [Kofleriaceae bacterium]|nr:glycoside hydrolase family 43 protein [Kofleriaceae bacterium]
MRAVVLACLLLAACSYRCGDAKETCQFAICVPDAKPFADAPHCSTRITYASTWIKPGGHPTNVDTVDDKVEWDGTCTDDGANSYATLSNGWKPYFTGHQACAIALDYSCPSECTTRITYGAAWSRPEDHFNDFDDVAGRVFSDGTCTNGSGVSHSTLSNGWQPYFSGTDQCAMSFRWTNCGGLFENPVIPGDCPDPGVTYDEDKYVLTCTSGNATNAFPIYTSTDLITWQSAGHIFTGNKPAWAVSDFWAPEIHYVGTQWVAYFTARGTDGMLAIGAATAPKSTGPYTPLAAPLVHSTSVGLIDATEFESFIGTGNTPYLAWKEDGNAINQPTPIKASELAADGLSLVGNVTTLITNDQTWEGALVEGPAVFRQEGDDDYYLFYSGNAYYDGRYAVGVAKASSPLGPYSKNPSNPILTTSSEWIGPGHCSVVYGTEIYKSSTVDPADIYMVYHAWQAGHVNGPGDGRMVLVDQVQWGSDGWPHLYGAPSSASRPAP